MRISKKILKSFVWLISVPYVLGLCLLWAAPYWPTRFWWLANLIQILPLWILPILSTGFLLIGILLKHKKIIFLHLFSCFLLITGIMGFKIPLTKLIKKNHQTELILKIMTMNIGKETDLNALLNYILEIHPDIIAFQEAYGETPSFLKNNLPSDRWDMSFKEHFGVVSRFKITSTDVQDRRLLEGWGGLIGEYELVGPFGPLYFFNVHLETPREGIKAILYKRFEGVSGMQKVTQLQEHESYIASKWASSQGGVIVAGDFNMREVNPIYQLYWSGFANAFSQAGFGFGTTKHTHWHSVRIDHILYDPNSWRALNTFVGPDLKGDHHPVITQIAFNTKFPQKNTIQRPSPKKQVTLPPINNIFYYENFESKAGLQTYSGQADITIDYQTRGDHALKIQSRAEAAFLSAGLMTNNWKIDHYPLVKFSYKIPQGTPVMVRVKTPLEDWICLGGVNNQCPAPQSQEYFQLIDDDQWHDLQINARSSVQSVLKAIKSLQEWQFYIPTNRHLGDKFWIDDFLIYR